MLNQHGSRVLLFLTVIVPREQRRRWLSRSHAFVAVAVMLSHAVAKVAVYL